MKVIDYSQKGIVFDIQKYSIHDGPGIRTIVFLKGCPLRCIWCSNPESQNTKPEIMFRKNLCIHCGKCVSICLNNAIGPQNKYWIDRKKCISCGECVNVCPSSALTLKGKEMTVEDVINEVKKDETYYRNSGGGITLSGGEALLQYKFAKELLKACHAKGWHTAVETEGYISKEVIMEVVPHIDLVLLDMKTYDTNLHYKYTKVHNEVIKENAKLIQSMTRTIIRIPVIPGVNDSVEEFSSIVKFVKTLDNVEQIHILPYHNYGENKYYLLGRDYLMKDTKKNKEEHLNNLKKIVEDNDLICQIGG
ncbi:glycyl-radical enzyme activating protein [Anaerococcus sp. AGMB09787]|uniref:glycyl-radical enzyme activating protein n=1 Tax=Anaerococcus sp. AGMB09787 TaxID=2922869 RepID=UPI001FAE9670|nr:glycyl-radical enzyme activating protein [Anaerococcus sp. AGMB09787]